MSSNDHIARIVAQVRESKPLPANIADLPAVLQRRLESEAIDQNTTPQVVLDAIRAEQEVAMKNQAEAVTIAENIRRR